MLTFEEQIVEFAQANFVPKFNPFFIPKLICDIVAGQIAMKYGFMGINVCTVSACASSTSAAGSPHYAVSGCPRLISRRIRSLVASPALVTTVVPAVRWLPRSCRDAVSTCECRASDGYNSRRARS
mgnify:CR=1 FL=1